LAFTEIQLSKMEKKMPLNVTNYCASATLALIGFASVSLAQTVPPPADPTAQTVASPTAKVPTAADVMRDRISKAKANIAVRNYPAALYELENIRRESTDPSLNAVVNVLMMNSYIEQGEYKRAEDLLKTQFESYKRNNAHADAFYQAVAGQVVKSARSQADRYRSLGLTVSDRNLPLEAVNDIEQMRGLVETVITQAKETSEEKTKAPAAVALLEEAMATRAAIARDDYDARRWRDAAADTREQIASSQSVVTNAIDGRPVNEPGSAASAPAASPSPQIVAVNRSVPEPSVQRAAAVEQPATKTTPANSSSASPAQPQAERPAPAVNAETRPAERPVRIVSSQPVNPPAPAPKPAEPEQTSKETSTETGPLEVGSLIGYATKRTAPAYPSTARQMRAAGMVRVEITVNEQGDVEEVQSMSGHALLQPAARDAIRKWKFKPFTRDGQPVKATGFVNFNFAL
jgi:protein TonB